MYSIKLLVCYKHLKYRSVFLHVLFGYEECQQREHTWAARSLPTLAQGAVTGSKEGQHKLQIGFNFFFQMEWIMLIGYGQV